MGDENSFCFQCNFVDFLLSEMIKQLIIGPLSTIQKQRKFPHLNVNAAYIPVFAWLHGARP